MVLVAKVSVHVPTHHHIDSGTTAGFYYLRQFLYCLHLYITLKIGQNKELILQAGITPKRLIQLDKRTLSGTVDGRHTLDNGSVCIRNNSIEYISIAIEQYPFFTLSHHIFVQTSKAIESIAGNDCAPLRIEGRPLRAIHYNSPVASAQVKSCVLLAGLYADGSTSVTEPALSRNHTELMLRYFGGSVVSSGLTAAVQPEPRLRGGRIDVPGDISSAAYFLAAALLIPGSEVLLRHVGINPTRDGILRVIRSMGGQVDILDKTVSGGEPAADLLVRSCPLHGTVIEGDLIPTLIDELPVLAVLAAFAEGTTTIRNAEELRVKESDRLSILAESLSAMGADVTETEDGLIIRGGKPLRGAVIHSHLDHRIAMSFAVAALAAEGETEITEADCVKISYPNFFEDLNSLTR